MAKSSSEPIQILDRQKMLGIKGSSTQDLTHINARLRMAWSKLQKTQQSAGQLRKTHLEDFATYKGKQKAH